MIQYMVNEALLKTASHLSGFASAYMNHLNIGLEKFKCMSIIHSSKSKQYS